MITLNNELVIYAGTMVWQIFIPEYKKIPNNFYFPATILTLFYKTVTITITSVERHMEQLHKAWMVAKWQCC